MSPTTTDPAGAAPGPLPFSVTGPAEFGALAPDRTGTTAFDVTNLTGRPLKVRLQPKGHEPAQDGWFEVVGESEVPMAMGATIKVEVSAKVPADAPAGAASMHLRAVDEADPELLTDGPAVGLTVPPPPAPPPPFPWKLVAAIAAVVVLVAGAAIWWFLFRKPPTPAPILVTPPAVAGEPNSAATLTTSNGVWEDAETFAYAWTSCDAMANNCSPIPDQTAATYTLTDADVGRLVKVTVTASGPGGTANADSTFVGPVNVTQVRVPNIKTEAWVTAKGHLEDIGLVIALQGGGESAWCNTVLTQDPNTDAIVDKGSSVTVTVKPQNCGIIFDPEFRTKLERADFWNPKVGP